MPDEIALDRRVDELLAFREGDDLVELPGDLGLGHAENRAVQEDVLAARQLGMKTGADLQQAGDPAPHRDLTGGRRRHLGKNLEQGALARAIPADDAQHFPFSDVEAHVVERQELLADPASVVLLPDFEPRVRLAPHLRPPSGHIVLERGAADHAQPIRFGDVFDRNDGRHGGDP